VLIRSEKVAQHVKRITHVRGAHFSTRQ